MIDFSQEFLLDILRSKKKKIIIKRLTEQNFFKRLEND